MLAKLDQVIGSISDAEFSFIVHEPSGIIDLSKAMSLLLNDLSHLSIAVSLWYLLKCICVKNEDLRLLIPTTS